ncbi:MAG: flagellar biosynthesis protein FlhA [Gemmataceae bacterium]|nr:flagellar biosynthesis protein FlhA [Gemmataceae bacterium]
MGSLIIGLTEGTSLVEVIRSHIHLTIGDGLISQIPALITAIAADIA